MDHAQVNITNGGGGRPIMAAHARYPSTTDQGAPYVDEIMNMAMVNSSMQRDGSLQYYAVNCNLHFCVKTYNSSATNGRLTESTLDTWRIPGNASVPNMTSLRFVVPPLGKHIIRASNFTIDNYIASFLGSWLSSRLIFSNSHAKFESASADFKGPTNNVLGAYQQKSSTPLESGGYGNHDVFNMMLRSSPEQRFGKLAESLTAYMRSVSAQEVPYEIYNATIPNDGPVQGISYELQAHIQIQWEWLSFPAAMLVLTFLFFLLIVVQSARSSVPVWKSSPLALLFHGLKLSSIEPSRLVTDIGGMEQRARGLKVKLIHSPSGFALQEEEFRRGVEEC
jgi:hypothetical protein